MARDTGGNVAVDFIWGNFPMQPNDDRGEATLDASLSNHSMVTNEWNGFPDDKHVAPYLDNTANVTVPDLAGKTEAQANSALTVVGLVKGTVTTADNAAGATSTNNGKVKTQSIAKDTVVNLGTSVDLVKYAYTA